MPAPVPAPVRDPDERPTATGPTPPPAPPRPGMEPEEIGRARAALTTLVFLSAYLWVFTDPQAEFFSLGAAAVAPLLLSRGPTPESWGVLARIVDVNSSLVLCAVVTYELLDEKSAGLPLWAAVCVQAFLIVYALIAVVKAHQAPGGAPVESTASPGGAAPR